MQIVQLCMYSGKQSDNPKDSVFISNTFQRNNWFLKYYSTILLLPPPPEYITVPISFFFQKNTRVQLEYIQFEWIWCFLEVQRCSLFLDPFQQLSLWCPLWHLLCWVYVLLLLSWGFWQSNPTFQAVPAGTDPFTALLLQIWDTQQCCLLSFVFLKFISVHSSSGWLRGLGNLDTDAGVHLGFSNTHSATWWGAVCCISVIPNAVPFDTDIPWGNV